MPYIGDEIPPVCFSSHHVEGLNYWKMNTVLRLSKGYASQLIYVVLLPFFFFFFCLVYDPFSFRDIYQVGGKSFAFHLSMLSSIVLVVLAITRLVFSALYRHMTFRWWHYVMWCAGEALAISFFFALYTTLFYNGGMPYFVSLPLCIRLAFLTLCYPYIVLILLKVIQNKTEDYDARNAETEDSLVKLYDEHQKLKFIIDPSAILYIGAEANYVKIHYLENDRVRMYMLRNSMKRIETAVTGHGMVRCHRSFFVNPRQVKVLSRGKDGITAEFKIDGIGEIPVGKLFYDKLADLL